MSNFKFVYAVLVISMISSTVAIVSELQLYQAVAAISGETSLIVDSSVIQGSIKVRTSDVSAHVNISVNISAESEEDIETIMVDFNEDSVNGEIIIIVRYDNTDPSGSAKTATAPTVLLGSLVMTFFMLQRTSLRSISLMALLFGGLWCVYAQAVTLPRADIEIIVPSDFVFNVITLKSTGIIDIDENLLTSNTDAQCLSGIPLIECPSCCTGNGECINGECLCDQGYINGTRNCSLQTSDTFQLYVSSTDPAIIAATTPEGDTAIALGNKTDEGIPVNVEEFRIIDPDGGETFVSLNEIGELSSAIDSTGTQFYFQWNSDYTSVNVMFVSVNSTEQFSINIDLTEPIIDDENNVTKRDADDIQFSERVAKTADDEVPRYVTRNEKQIRQKRQVSQTSATVSVTVETCEMPQQNAIVIADGFLGYDSDTGSYDTHNVYYGVETIVPGLYLIAVPTKPSSIAVETFCDSVEIALANTCDIWDEVSEVTKRFTKVKPETIICTALERAAKKFLQFEFITTLINKICKQVFVGFNVYCDRASTDTSPADLICDAVSGIIDPVVDIFNQQNIFFEPYAVFPDGNTVRAEGRILDLPSGSSDVSTTFNIVNDESRVSIVSTTVVPADPDPGESYVVTVVYECYSINTVVIMTIVGTDGYTDTISCANGPTCVLQVPGAAALVVDTVTIGITDPNLGSANSVLTIIF